MNDQERDYLWRRLQRHQQRRTHRVEWQADLVMVLFALASVIALALVVWRLP